MARPPPPPRHAAVALDVEYTHYALPRSDDGDRKQEILRIPAEVAVVGDDGGELLHARVSRPPELPPTARRVDGGEVGATAPLTLTPDDARDAVAALLTGGAVLVGHGVATDAASLRLPLPPRVVDTAAALTPSGGSTPSLDALVAKHVGDGEEAARRTGGSGRGRHSALTDALLAMRVYVVAVRGTPADAAGRVEDAAARIVAEWERREGDEG